MPHLWVIVTRCFETAYRSLQGSKYPNWNTVWPFDRECLSWEAGKFFTEGFEP